MRKSILSKHLRKWHFTDIRTPAGNPELGAIGRLETMKSGSHEVDEASPRVVLYTRQGCHLCDDAKKLLEEFGIRPRSVDIDADAALRARFNECVPVVEIDGKIRFRGRVDPVLLRRLLSPT